MAPAERLRLVDSVAVLPADGGIRFVHGAQALRVRGSRRALGELGSRLRAGVSAADLAALPPGAALPRVLARLRALGWVTAEPAGQRAGTAAERQIGYLSMFGPDALAMQARLDQSRVGLLGVGGVGGVVAQHLAGAGVRALWLVDHDTVAVHNLNRQFLFGEADIGMPKAAATAAALARLAAGVQARAVPCRVTRPADLDALPVDLHLLVVAADRPPDIVGIAWRWAREHGVPLCTAAVGLETGYWGPLLAPRLGHCWPCFERARRAALPADQAALADAAHPPTPYSFGPVNTTISALLAYGALRFLATGGGPLLNRRGHLSFADGRTAYLAGGGCSCEAST